MEHDIPFGNSNRENETTFLDFPLFLGIFQWDEPTKRVPFTAEPEIPEILTKWKASLVHESSHHSSPLVATPLFLVHESSHSSILPPIFSSAMPYFAFFSLFLNALSNDTFHPLLGILALLFCITPLARLSPCFRRTAVLNPRVKSKFLFPFLTHFPLKWLGEVILYQALYDHVLYSHNLRD